MKIVIQGVELPKEANEDFCTPDFHDLIEFYPKYRELVKDPWPIQPYLTYICKILAKSNCRPGRTESDWFTRFVHHFGWDYVSKVLGQTYE